MREQNHTPAQAVESPGSTGLKAERIQIAAPVEGTQRLKAERIQLVLRDLPSWTFERSARVISRSVALRAELEVTRVYQMLADLGAAGWSLPDLMVRSNRVVFSFPVGEGAWVAGDHFELAKALDSQV